MGVLWVSYLYLNEFLNIDIAMLLNIIGLLNHWGGGNHGCGHLTFFSAVLVILLIEWGKVPGTIEERGVWPIFKSSYIIMLCSVILM